MKKNAKYLLIMLAILVVLGGAAAALLLTDPAGDDGASEVSDTPGVTLTAVDPGQVSSITVESNDYSYVIVPAQSGEVSAETETASSAVDFTLEGYESGNSIDTVTLSTAVGTVLGMESSKELGEQAELEKFGLAGEEAITVTVKDTTGGEESFVLGIEGGETSGRYVLKDGSVYIVDGVSAYFYSDKYIFFEKEIYTVGEVTVDSVNDAGEYTTETMSDILYSAVITRSDMETPIEISYDYDSGIYSMVSPLEAAMDATIISDMLTDLKSVTADKIVAEEKTDELLAQYGLDVPYAEIVFNMNGEERTMAVSELDENSNRYLIEDYSKFIYQIDDASVSSWASTTVEQMRSSVILQPSVYSLSALTMVFEGDMAFTYEIEQVLDEENSTEESPAYTYTVTDYSGAEMEMTQFEHIFSTLTGVSVLSTEQPEAWGEPILSLIYTYREGGEDTVEFCEVEGEERYAVLLNGEFNGVVRKSDIDDLSFA